MIRRLVDWEGIFVFLLAFGVYINTLHHGFVYDDNRAVLGNPDILASSPLINVFQNDFWGTPLSSSNSHGSYRPLCVLSFRLNHWASGLKPFGFHLTNIILHGIATTLVLMVGRIILPGKSALFGSVLFAVHPIHTEAVAGVVGRADILSCIFVTISFLFYNRHVEKREAMGYSNNKSKKEDFVVIKCKRTSGPVKRNSSVQCYFENFSENVGCRLRLFPERDKTNFAFYLVFAVCAMLSKEPGISAIPLAVSYDIILHLRSRRLSKLRGAIVSSISSSVIWCIVLLFLRLCVMGLQAPHFSKADNPTARDPSLLTRTLSFLYLPFFNFILLLFPGNLSFDWSMDAIPRVTSIIDNRFILTILFYCALYCTTTHALNSKKTKNTKVQKLKVCKTCKKDSGENHLQQCKISNNNNLPLQCNCLKLFVTKFPIESTVPMCLAFLVIPFIPASNLFFYVGFVVAERVLYTCSIGFCFLVALGVNFWWSRSKTTVIISSIVLVGALTAKTLQRNKDWANEESLYRSAVDINPPKAYGNLGSILSTKGRLEEAETALRLALKHRPNMADVHYNLGNLQARQKSYKDAEDSYRLSIQYRPTLAVAYLNLGHVLEVQEDWTEAESIYIKCSELAPTGLKDPQSHEDARSSCVLRLNQLCRSHNCGEDATEVLKYQAVKKNESSSKKNGNDMNLKEMNISNSTSRNEGEEMFRRAIRKDSKDPAGYLRYGQFLVQQGRRQEAAEQFVKAVGLAPHQHTLVTSAAIALRQAGRLAEAEIMYRNAREIRPLDATSHSNLGAIFHLQGKYRQAANSYKEALRLAPGDHVTLTNLQKLRNILAKNKR